MKPIRLEMSAWGSYPEVTTVDFTKFQEGSLFLITGPTGAGKTTVFDAISFALYGNVSGKLREKASVRSDFSSPDVDTYVELIFSHKGKEYRIKRAPKYSRPKKRGEGFTVSSETAELYIEEQLPIVSMQEVNRKIDEIMGINYDQFKQIAMIAQGEFLELLVSNSKDRVEIFRNLFKTEKYESIQRVLAEKSKRIYSAILELTNKIDEAVSNIEVIVEENLRINPLDYPQMLNDELLENRSQEDIDLEERLRNGDIQGHIDENQLEEHQLEEHQYDELKSELELSRKIPFELKQSLEAEYKNYEKIITLTKEYIQIEKKKVLDFTKEIEKYSEDANQLLILISEGENHNKQVERLNQIINELVELQRRQEEITQIEEALQLATRAEKVAAEEKLYDNVVNRLGELVHKKDLMKVDIESSTLRYEESQRKFEKTKEYNEKIKALQEEYRTLEGYIPLFEELTKVTDQLNELASTLRSYIDQFNEVKAEYGQIKEQRETLSGEYNQYSNVETSIGERNLHYSQVNQLVEDIKVALDKKRVLQEEKKSLYVLQEKFQREEKQLKELKEIYETNEEIYKKAAIGLAAKFLEDNMPCPVCGSLDHPKKATISHDVPDEEKLEALKSQYEKARETYNESYNQASKQHGVVTTKESEYEELLNKLSINEEELEAQYQENKVKQHSLKEQLEVLNQQLIRKNTIQQELTKMEERMVVLEADMELKKVKYEEVKSEFDVGKGNYNQIKSKLPESLDSTMVHEQIKELKDRENNYLIEQKSAEEDYQNNKVSLQNKKTLMEAYIEEEVRLQKEVQNQKVQYEDSVKSHGFDSIETYKESFMDETKMGSLKDMVKKFYESLQEKVNTRDHLIESTQGKKEVDVDTLKLQYQQLEKQRKALQKDKELLNARVLNNKKALESMKGKMDSKKELDEEYGIVKDLDNVARGNNSERLVFEHYVLGTYFEDIIQSANIRLSVMTNSRYELQKVSKVTDARTKDSLDLEVLDHYTGKKRSVKTLSGGESFKAALSLALGLSDIVQNNAGGIQIDTLFIDEGFGSLDSESLDQALKTLTSLTEHNRLIGIISHVSELKERIDNQIIVDKGNNGSKLRVIS